MQIPTIRVVWTPPIDGYSGYHVYQVLQGDEKIVGGSYTTSDTNAVLRLAFKRALEKGFTHYIEFGSVAAPRAIPAAASG
jgi:hypothetical protein